MCGRFNLRAPSHQLVEFFGLQGFDEFPAIAPRFNIAPTQPVLGIRSEGGRRVPAMLKWGLIPSWSKDPKQGARMINARGETVATKPAFRAAFKRRRCLIPVSGFYEWKKLDAKHKQPFHIGMRDGAVFACAGLWEYWEDAEGSGIESCTIITTSANEIMCELHDRMPVILAESDFDRWLTTAEEDARGLESLLTPFSSEHMQHYPVSTTVNNARHEVPECIEPLEAESGSMF
ncbi:MAG: SOS response-associated peptidase [Planctomycetota bacterium]|nr:SOS response-associated peptidase [Planctomycetota bacterium]